jgi:hypothetical protein
MIEDNLPIFFLLWIPKLYVKSAIILHLSVLQIRKINNMMIYLDRKPNH